jgi:arylsulfatase A-like enzyme
MLAGMSWNRREFLGAAALAAAGRKPNLIWIMADDLGWGDLGCYGQEKIRTPNLDRMATEGMRFMDAYAGCTVCAPSRSVLMTGLHMGHTSVRSNPGGVPLVDSDVTVAEVLKSAGYRTGCFGKWGLGDIGTSGVPWRQGFDDFFGYLHQVHAHWYYPEFLYENEKRYPLSRGAYSHDAIAGKALDFIRRNRSHPFFCYIPFTIPHWELLAPEDSLAEYRGRFPVKAFIDPRNHYGRQEDQYAAYAGMITRMDRDVGRVLALVKELGLDRDTAVFFTSDNGQAWGIRGDDFFRSAGPFRGHKQNFYEGGIRVPFIARWPGRIAAEKVSRHPWYFADFLPTAAELAGAVAPREIDGLSIVPELTGGMPQRHEFLYWELPSYDNAKQQFADEMPMQAVRMGAWKAVRPKPNAPLELYNLDEDQGETRNVAAERRDVLAKFEAYLKTARTPPRPQGQPPHDFHPPAGGPRSGA